jgi:3-dehydrotetronate 4-kinase
MSRPLLGCIADDFTGATDLANNLVRSGMRVIQTIGVPEMPLPEAVDAVVVCLKSRTIAPALAVSQSLAALTWLQSMGASQIYFKYCSTFDSTPQGNIGPVIDALMKALNTSFTVATPAFPDAGRTVYRGYLFVGDVLLNESGMQDHPLTPMKDANLQRVLQAQTDHRVGLVDYEVVKAGQASIQAKFEALRSTGVGIAVLDVISNDDLLTLGAAVKDMPLVTAGSGLAIGLASNFGLSANPQAAQLPKPQGYQAMIAGSCSRATQAQVAAFIAAGGQAIRLDPVAAYRAHDYVQQLATQALDCLALGPVLVYSTDSPDALKSNQGALGAQVVGQQIEGWLATIAQKLWRGGVRQWVVAGGETSGAVVQALALSQLRIGPQVDPGVPWCYGQSGLDGQSAHICLKSGNFGGEDFFSKAFGVLS